MEHTGPLISLLWQGTGLTDIGLVRTSNQDAFALENQLGLWVIADGMGGHAGGSIASQIAVQSVVDRIRGSLGAQASTRYHPADADKLLRLAIASGDDAIRRRALTNPDLSGMGTTLVAALYCPGPPMQIAIAHIGDSRAYLIRSHSIRLLTTDHSFVQRLLAEGQITPEEAQAHPQQHILLKALGTEDQALPDIAIHPLEPEDILLLCTDGLTKTVSEDDILSIVLGAQESPVTACRNLIERSNAHGGKDNTTVVLVRSHHAPQ